MFPPRQGSPLRTITRVPSFPYMPLPDSAGLVRPACPPMPLCSRKSLSAPVGLVSLPGMLLPDTRPLVALGMLSTSEGFVGCPYRGC